MRLGMTTQELHRDNVDDIFREITDIGYTDVQLNFWSLCGNETPTVIEPAWVDAIERAAERYGVTISAVNGTFNLISESAAERENGLKSLRAIAAQCKRLGIGMISLNTGTRSTESMWTYHPDNASRESWREMLGMMEKVIVIGEQYGVTFGIEPEVTNVVSSPDKARQLLDEMRTPCLKIIFDGANLFQPGQAKPALVRGVLDHAFELLAEDIGIAHGKDLLESDEIAFTAPGRGIMDYPYFFRRLKEIGYGGSFILHGIHEESDLAWSYRHIRAIADKYFS